MTVLQPKLVDLKANGDAADWLDDSAYETLKQGYLLPNETPRQMYRRVANSAARYLNKPELADKFYKYIDNNWVCLASPVASNAGTERGLPISCLTGDSMINTPEGVEYLKNIKEGDLVLTHKGRYRKVTKKTSRMSSGDMYELIVSNRRTKLRITGNHPIKTNLGWVRVDELDINKHLVAGNRLVQIEEKLYTINTSLYTPKIKSDIEGNSGRFALKEIVDKVSVTEEVAWALGLWFAEGSITTTAKGIPNALRITMGAEEVPVVEKWVEIMSRNFGVNGNWYSTEITRKGKVNRWINGYVSSQTLATWFTEEFGRGCKNKKPSKWISELPKPESKAFLDGFIQGDGCKKSPNADKSYVILSNPYIIGTLYNLGLKLEIPMSVDFTHKKTSDDRYWHYGISFYIENVISLAAKHKHNKSKKCTSGIPFEDGLIYFPIRSLSKLDKDEEVFDLTVEEDHSFSVAGIVVHNCYSVSVPDDLSGIYLSFHETAMLTKHGGGVGKYWGRLRQRGSKISSNGFCDGVIPWLKVEEATLTSTSQGGVRRGSGAQYLPIESNEIEEFIDIRRPTGDSSRRCLSNNFHHAVCISDDFMDSLRTSKKSRQIWERLLNTRIETGEPYILFRDTVNKQAPECYKKNNLTIETSNLCSEIALFTDPEHSFVCCLSSLNLARWDEWKDTDVVEVAIWFLDGIMEEFIQKASSLPGFEHAVNFAKKGRALGLGALGWHTLLQSKGIPFESFQAMQLNAEIFKTIDDKSLIATKQLALEYGEPEWCKGFGIRNTHRTAVAPTVSNSIISGGVSQGIEPIIANCFAQKSAKGTFIRKNKQLELLLDQKGKNTFEIWDQINSDNGSVKDLDFLTTEEKELFYTAYEINQYSIIRQASQRQKFIDQAQSLNLFIPVPKVLDNDSRLNLGIFLHKLHKEAYDLGLKSLYYNRSQSILKGDLVYREEGCRSCES